MRVAVAQSAAVPGDTHANARTALRLISAARDRGADLVVFPELFLCGYDLRTLVSAPDRSAVDLEDESVSLLRRACSDTGVSVVMGACVRRPTGVSNSAIVISGGGEVVDVYDKAYLWAEERGTFVPGGRLSLVDLAGFRVGVAICYDAGFPEHIRALALGGAEVIACPSAFALGDEQRRYRMYFPMRALENTVYVAVSNLMGTGGETEFFGESAIFDPAGRLLASAGAGAGVVVAEVSRDAIASVRGELRYLEHRRPELYP